MESFVVGYAMTASLIVAIGAQNVYVLQQGLRREHVACVVALCAASDLVLIGIGVAGLSGAASLAPRITFGLTLGGAVFLVWYGAAAARRALTERSMVVATGEGAKSRRAVVAETLAITLLNPHVYLDTLLLLGAIGAQQPAAQRPLFVLGAGLASVMWFAGLGFGAGYLTPVFSQPKAWRVLDAAVAATMWALAASLLLGAW